MFKVILSIFILSACANITETNITETQTLDPQKEKYWYAGEAEITSFILQQARYGEIREGTAAMIFVTEPFSKKSNTKSDRPTENDPSVLKLNFTKNFNTGIYPYSMMTSTFVPFNEGDHSLKISSSSQEWCGHTFMELKNKNKFEIDINSYFEGESGELSLSKNLLEDDIWSLIRLHPENLPEGNIKAIPSFFYLRLSHVETKAYDCAAKKIKVDEITSAYELSYPALERSLLIRYETAFPHKILGWEEKHFSGFGNGKKHLVTTGERIKTIKSAYWEKNGNKDDGIRVDLFEGRF